jgi:hypothetical protein
MEKQLKRFASETKALEDSRSLIVIVSAATPDRYADRHCEGLQNCNLNHRAG